MPPSVCPLRHALRRRKSDGDCERDVRGGTAQGLRVFDCRQCEFRLRRNCLAIRHAEEALVGSAMFGLSLERELEVAVGQATAQGWIERGKNRARRGQRR